MFRFWKQILEMFVAQFWRSLIQRIEFFKPSRIYIAEHKLVKLLFSVAIIAKLFILLQVDCYGDPDKSGRRKREIPKFLPHYSNEVFEVEVSAFLRIKSHVEGDIIIEESEFLFPSDQQLLDFNGYCSSEIYLPDIGCAKLRPCILFRVPRSGSDWLRKLLVIFACCRFWLLFLW